MLVSGSVYSFSYQGWGGTVIVGLFSEDFFCFYLECFFFPWGLVG